MDYCDLCSEEIQPEQDYICEWCEEMLCQVCYFELSRHDTSGIKEEVEIMLQDISSFDGDIDLDNEFLCAYCDAVRNLVVKLKGDDD